MKIRDASPCSHSVDTSGYVDTICDYTGASETEWVVSERLTYEDIDVGRFRCTQCGLVQYYTGRWRDFWEKGIPCPGSERLTRSNPMNIRDALIQQSPSLALQRAAADEIARLDAIVRALQGQQKTEPADPATTKGN